MTDWGSGLAGLKARGNFLYLYRFRVIIAHSSHCLCKIHFHAFKFLYSYSFTQRDIGLDIRVGLSQVV